MYLDLVRFSDTSAITPMATRLKADCIAIAGAARQQLPQEGRPKYISCALLEKPDGNALRKARATHDFTAAQGSSPEMCSWAANNGTRLLLQPFSTERNYIDSQTANVLARNSVFTGMLFSDFLNARGQARQLLVKNAAQCLKVLHASKASMLFFSGARSANELRAPKDLASFAVLLGMEREDALKAVRNNPKTFLEGKK